MNKLLSFLVLMTLLAPAFSQEFKFPGKFIFCIKDKADLMETSLKDLRRFKEKVEEMIVNKQMFKIFNPERMESKSKLLTESEFLSQKYTGPTHIIFYWISIKFKDRMAGGEFFLDGILYIEKLSGGSLTGSIWKRVSGGLRSKELGLIVENKDDWYNREICIDKFAEDLAGRLIKELAKDVIALGKQPGEASPFGTAPPAGKPVKLSIVKNGGGKDNLIHIGEATKFTAKIIDENGQLLDLPLLWTVLGSNQAGKIAREFVFTADKAGDYVLKAVEPNSGLKKTCFLHAEWQKISKIEIDLLNTRLLTGQKTQITARVYDADKELIPHCPVEWRTNAGTIEKGIFTAGNNPGSYEIMATDKAHRCSARIKIKVISEQPLSPKVTSSPPPKKPPLRPKKLTPRPNQSTTRPQNKKSRLMSNLRGKILLFRRNNNGYWEVQYQVTNRNSITLSNMVVMMVLSDKSRKQLGQWRYDINKNFPPQVPVVITKKWHYSHYPTAQYINAHVKDFSIGSRQEQGSGKETGGMITVNEPDFGGSYNVRGSWKRQIISATASQKEVSYLIEGTNAAVTFMMIKNKYLSTAFFQAVDSHFQTKAQTDASGPSLLYSFSKTEKPYTINGLSGKLITYSGYSANFIGYRAEYFFSQRGNIVYIAGLWAQEGVFNIYAAELRKAMHSLRQAGTTAPQSDSPPPSNPARDAFISVYESGYNASFQVDPTWTKKITADQANEKVLLFIRPEDVAASNSFVKFHFLRNSMNLQQLVNVYERFFQKNFNSVYRQTINYHRIGNLNGQMANYIADYQGSQYKLKFFFAVTGGNCYIVGCAALSAQFDEISPGYQRSMETLRIGQN